MIFLFKRLPYEKISSYAFRILLTVRGLKIKLTSTAANRSVSRNSLIELPRLFLVQYYVLFYVGQLREDLVAGVALPMYALFTSLRILYANRLPRFLILFLLVLKNPLRMAAGFPFRQNFTFVVHEAWGAPEGSCGTGGVFWGDRQLLRNYIVMVSYARCRDGDFRNFSRLRSCLCINRFVNYAFRRLLFSSCRLHFLHLEFELETAQLRFVDGLEVESYLLVGVAFDWEALGEAYARQDGPFLDSDQVCKHLFDQALNLLVNATQNPLMQVMAVVTTSLRFTGEHIELLADDRF